MKNKSKILPKIKLKYFTRPNDKDVPVKFGLSCDICGGEIRIIGSLNSINRTYNCLKCTIKKYKTDYGFKTLKEAESYRRRMFDVEYLFQEMIVDEYLKKNSLVGFENLSEDVLQKLLDKASKIYDSNLTKRQKTKLEHTYDQKDIVKVLKKFI